MHQHTCRHCRIRLICDERADECFQKFVTCQACFWNHDFRKILLVLFLLLVALAATVYLYRETKKPAFTAPVQVLKEKTSTGENYYENERKTS